MSSVGQLVHIVFESPFFLGVVVLGAVLEAPAVVGVADDLTIGVAVGWKQGGVCGDHFAQGRQHFIGLTGLPYGKDRGVCGRPWGCCNRASVGLRWRVEPRWGCVGVW